MGIDIDPEIQQFGNSRLFTQNLMIENKSQ